MTRRHGLIAAIPLLMMVLSALALSLYNTEQILPYRLWTTALWHPDEQDIRQVIFYYSALPRLVISLLVGAGLALAGVLFQQVLRNPLAEPSTLGISSGAQLGMTVATLWTLPGGQNTQQVAAMLGALAIGVLVFGVAWGKRLSPVTLILAGLVLSLYCSAVNNLLALFHYQRLENLFLWSSGALNQQDWQGVVFVLPRLAIALLLAMLLIRPMTLLGVDDGVARNLGLGLSVARLAALGLAIVLSAQLVNAVGIVGFIGLFAPLLAKLLGARRLRQRLLLALPIGALLLWFTDQLMVWLAQIWRDVPTGAATALIGAPILLGLLPRLRYAVAPATDDAISPPHPERAHPLLWSGLGLVALLAVMGIMLMLGRDSQGWFWAGADDLARLLPWRWPRMLAALSAGMMLAVAGTLIQKLTGNPMGSPEVLGISAGAASAVVFIMFLVPGDAFIWLLPAGSVGAALTLAAILLVSGRRHFSPQRMLLAGIALGSAFTTLITLLLISGDPRLGGLLSWISGSTYGVRAPTAIASTLTALVLFALIPLCHRWLAMLPLGGDTARGLGLPLMRARMTVLLLAAMLTAAATLTVGPLSFVGLMSPHMARMMGFRKAPAQMTVAALLGGALMLIADWCGRMLLFPNQIPAGLLATFIGAPYFIILLRRQAH
ncbi:Fe(3+)-hydroxamate ABC transporter permease FhuB [Acerihabitans sp. TG2]|uniref:Fe(3+)-hydroxamate ABC transporter permease FhuB n=1 Tax=Acerihabitans sp. TG2 TaxID=3096008 RepID=UPI002B22D817|nr:Fe(3+)-hydroxamate ABC transporter permease FhuB [Acerihabitans sp. TG2]MEA9391836.1 Fe(3+)-hydroxamate ABC transporter permease FhuB [Acerihabitans sp. TG2]